MHPLSETLRAAAKHIRHFDEAPSVRAAADELDRLHSVELMARESFANTHLIRQRCVEALDTDFYGAALAREIIELADKEWNTDG